VSHVHAAAIRFGAREGFSDASLSGPQMGVAPEAKAVYLEIKIFEPK
jgi:hypothetical protein